MVSYLFDEENPALKSLIKETIRAAKVFEIKVGLCGQAPSDLPQFTKFLVEALGTTVSLQRPTFFMGRRQSLMPPSHLKFSRKREPDRF